MALILKDKTYIIIGACMEVHRQLGNSFQEPVYQEALELEFKERNIPFAREVKLTIDYKGSVLRKQYSADFICYNEIILEIKSVSGLVAQHTGQVLNYLNASHLKIGLLINFGTNSLTYRRIIH